jgi:hypothetical protein
LFQLIFGKLLDLVVSIFGNFGDSWFVLGDWSMNERERESLLQKEKNLENFETFLFVLGDWSMNVLQKKEKKKKKKLGTSDAPMVR